MIIYKKDSKGKIRTLEVTTLDKLLMQESGLLGGKLVTHSKECKPKNVGKSNATTAEEQAVVQAEALIAKKLREGYFDNELDAKNSSIILPMLAKDYFKESHKLVNKALAVQPKLDGIRCMLFYDHKTGEVKTISRTNKPLDNVQHIIESVKNRMYDMNVTQDYIFDGELYVHGKTFQEVTKLVKNKPGEELVQYHIYDMIDINIDFVGRTFNLESLFGYNLQYVKLVSTTLNPVSPLRTFYEGYIAEGYEGMMVRVKNSKYKVNGRSSDLLKYKEFIDIALPIIDITPNDADPTQGTVWVEYKGKKVKTGAKLSHDDRKELLTNKNDYIGLTAEIRFFEFTDEGSLRFPVYHGIRIDK